MDGTEMLKMMQQAFELSKTFGGEDTGNGFEQAINMFRLFSPEPPRQEKQRFGNDNRTQALDSIKSAIPYIDLRYQRYISVFVKLIEIQMMMEMYSKSASSMYGGVGKDWRKAMLESLRPHLDKERSGMIDFLIAFIDLNDASYRIKEPNSISKHGLL